MPALLDELSPRFDFREQHATVARAEPEHAYGALRSADLGGPVVRLLLTLRGLPALLRGGAGASAKRAQRGTVRLDDFLRAGFALLGEDPPRELVFGVAGRPWRARPDTLPLDVASFRTPVQPGTVRVATNFMVVPDAPGSVRISTETRIECADPAARRRFGLYWLAIRAGSGLIRRAWLRSIRVEAERLTRAASLPAASPPARSRR